MRNALVIVVVAIAAIVVGVLVFLYGGDTTSNASSPIVIEDNPVVISFTKLAQGVHSTVATRTNYLITAESELKELWKMVDANGTVPAVDFNKNYVAAVFAGQKMTGGYEITVSKVEDTSVRNVVVTLADPGSDCMVTQSTTAPYQIIELPKTPLTFTHQDQAVTTSCSQ
ncbi:MAG: protease complex subunit PrcB family protein [Candidatus Paceibacterota bacterium]|jgi:hypothetical protein